MGEPRTWKTSGYLLSKLPLGVAAFVITVTLVTTSLALTFAPAYAWANDDENWAPGGWDIAAYPWPFTLVPASLLLTPISTSADSWMTTVSGASSRRCFDRPHVAHPGEMPHHVRTAHISRRHSGGMTTPQLDTTTSASPVGLARHNTINDPTQHRAGRSRWWRWARGALAALTLVVAAGAWLLGQTFTVFLFAPVVVVVATVAQRVLAAIQGRLNTGLVTAPFHPDNRPDLAQFLLRAVLAGLVLLAAGVALLDIQAGGLASPNTQWALVAGPVAVFVALQLIPSRPVSRSANALVVIVAAFLAFQLVQIHYRSGVDDAVSIAAPFEGEWFVPSGGRSSLVSHHWTPLADQRYAVDFVIAQDGHTHDGDPDDLSAYYCWDQPLLAPADGTVVAAEDGRPDMAIGETDADNAAGNVVVIDIGDDRYVLLAHLRQGTVSVTVGQPVSTGDIVGRCGNSGHSLEPHLHMQVQDGPASINQHQDTGTRGGLATYPFRFTDATHIRGGTEHPSQDSLFRRNYSVRVDN